MKESGAAPCQCSSPGGQYTVCPVRTSTLACPRDCTHATPCVTWRVYPRACECQAVRAPGAKRTLATIIRCPSARGKANRTHEGHPHAPSVQGRQECWDSPVVDRLVATGTVRRTVRHHDAVDVAKGGFQIRAIGEVTGDNLGRGRQGVGRASCVAREDTHSVAACDELTDDKPTDAAGAAQGEDQAHGVTSEVTAVTHPITLRTPRGVTGVTGTGSPPLGWTLPRPRHGSQVLLGPPTATDTARNVTGMASNDHRAEIKEFLSSRRARITPEQAGLPSYGGNRRVKGLRREEVAMLAGVSADYYVRMERGNLAGASDGVLEAVASALKLDDAERDHLFALARESTATTRVRHKSPSATVRAPLQQILDAVQDAPAWIRNARHDILAMNPLAAALYAPVLADPRRPANTTRFVYLHPEQAKELFVDYDQVARDAAAMLRLEAGRNPQDKGLIELVGELSTQSDLFRQRWASQDVRYHRSGRKRLRHPVVGELDLDFEALTVPSEPGLQLNIYTAAVGTPAYDALRLLASWVATADHDVSVTD